MKKIIFVVCMLCTSAAFAANEESVTSREYVDAGLAATQSTLTTTGTGAMTFDSSETDGIGQKPIYNPNGDYAAQQDALVSASTANAAVQNAIAAEFVCIAWKNDDPNDECLLVQIKNTTPRPSGKNLFDLNRSKVIYRNSPRVHEYKLSNGYTVQQTGSDSANSASFVAIELGNINDYRGKTLRISAQTSCINGGVSEYIFAMCNDDCSTRVGNTKTLTVPEQPDVGLTKVAFRLYAVVGSTVEDPACTYTNIQVEEGSTATTYEPYQNLYLPTGQ